MEPTIVSKESMNLIGVDWSGPYTQREIPELWKVFVERVGEIGGRINQSEYVCPSHGRKTDFTYYITVQVASLEAIPAGMKGIIIPAQTYVKITHRGPMEQVGETYDRLFRWMAESGYQPNREELWLEVYDDRYRSAIDDPNRAENEYEIYMPVQQK